MLTETIYDQHIAWREKEIFKQEEEIKKIEQSKANLEEYMGIHASLWDEQKWLESKRRIRATVYPNE